VLGAALSLSGRVPAAPLAHYGKLSKSGGAVYLVAATAEPGTSETRWDWLQRLFKDSWIGTVVLGLVTAVGVLSVFSEQAKKLVWWAPVSDVSIQGFSVKPLAEYRKDYRNPATLVGTETVYPVGAILDITAEHNRKGDEVIRINSLDVKVVSYEPDVSLPFRLTGDQIRGAGTGKYFRQFEVRLSGGRVETVTLTEPNGPERNGRSHDLLDVDPPFPLVLRKGDDPEILVVELIADDTARYRVSLSMSYTNRKKSKTIEVASVSFCNPRDAEED